MSREKDKPGPDVRGSIEQLLGRPILPGISASMQDIQIALTQAAAAVADARAERDHYRAAYGIIETEMVMLASVLLKRMGKDAKIIVKAEEFKRFSDALQLVSSNPEPGVRMYQLQKLPRKDSAKVVIN